MCRNGHNFERAALEAWVLGHGSCCPTCRTDMTTVDHFFPNLALRETIEEWRTSSGSVVIEAKPAPRKVYFVDSKSKNLLTFTPGPQQGLLQYTVNGRDPRPPFGMLVFDGAWAYFPDIGRSAALPASDWAKALSDMFELAMFSGARPCVRFRDPETENVLTFLASVERQGHLQYTINEKELRPPFCRLFFDGARVGFEDIAKHATLPSSDWDYVLEEFFRLLRLTAVRAVVRFTDSATSNKLVFETTSCGFLRYTVNGSDSRPPFRQLSLEGSRVKFLDIDRWTTLPTSLRSQTVEQLVQLARLSWHQLRSRSASCEADGKAPKDQHGVQPTVRFTDPETNNALTFSVTPDGCLRYVVNETESRPPFREIALEEGPPPRVKFVDIGRSATLPEGEAGDLWAQLQILRRVGCW